MSSNSKKLIHQNNVLLTTRVYTITFKKSNKFKSLDAEHKILQEYYTSIKLMKVNREEFYTGNKENPTRAIEYSITNISTGDIRVRITFQPFRPTIANLKLLSSSKLFLEYNVFEIKKYGKVPEISCISSGTSSLFDLNTPNLTIEGSKVKLVKKKKPNTSKVQKSLSLLESDGVIRGLKRKRTEIFIPYQIHSSQEKPTIQLTFRKLLMKPTLNK